MKKLFLIFASVITFSVSLLAVDCYGAWMNSFNNATTQYILNLDRCGEAWIRRQYCFDEAEMIYTNAINAAGDAYYFCVR